MASCPRPMHGFYTGRLTAKGGQEIIRTNRKITEIKWEHWDEKKQKYIITDLVDYIEIPCGTCEICKANQAKKKAERAIAEASIWENNYVINLTYNEENVPYNINKKDEKVQTLRYKDLQNFKKRLLEHWERKYNKKNIRFMCASEYGEKHKRPHYHLILFNFEIEKKYDWGRTKKGSKQWRSTEIEKIWGKGNVTIGESTPETIHYVANYCLKKFKGKQAKGIYEEMGIEPERVTQSNRKGLGASLYEKQRNLYKEHGKCLVGTFNGLKTITANRYFDKLMSDELGENVVKQCKEKRRILAEQREMTRAFTSKMNIEELRKNEERAFLEKIKHAKKRNFKNFGETG